VSQRFLDLIDIVRCVVDSDSEGMAKVVARIPGSNLSRCVELLGQVAETILNLMDSLVLER
jgi:hypothetical protein